MHLWFCRRSQSLARRSLRSSLSEEIAFHSPLREFFSLDAAALIAMRPQIVEELRAVFAAKNREDAERLLRQMVEFYAKGAPLLATWLETDIPEGLNCFELPKAHQERMRTTNMVERVNQELKRRTRVIRIFPNVAPLLRVIIARLSELSDDWETGKVHLSMNPKSQLLAA